MWRPGFTGRQNVSEVEVLNPDGEVVAITGRNYMIAGGGIGAYNPSAFWACGGSAARTVIDGFRAGATPPTDRPETD